MLTFNPTTGLVADDVETVREAVRADWVAAFTKDGQPELNTEPETPAGQLIDSQTAAIVNKDGEVLYLANQFNPLTAEGVWQDALGKIYFLTRQVQQASVAQCVCTGFPGTVIPAGALVKSEADGTFWSCDAALTIPQSGMVTGQFTARTAGPLEAGADTLTQIVTIVPGWDAVTNPAAATVGRDAETQAEFEARRFQSVAANARGSVNALYGTIADLDGVIDCVVLENTGSEPAEQWGVTIPGHSVWIAVIGGANADIAQAIYSKKDAGCGTAGNTSVTYQDTSLPGQPIYTYQIERPAPLPFGVKVTITMTPTTPAEIEQLIQSAVLADFEGTGISGNLRVGMAQTVYASRFYNAVIQAGAIGLQSIEVCAPASGEAWADFVTVNADQAPVLDAADIIVDIVGD